MKRIVFWMMLALLPVGTLASVFNVGLARAIAETVYINSDGSVFPSNAPISSVDNVTYIFTGNISYPAYNGIIVGRNDIVIDGNRYTVQGTSAVNSVGIDLTARNNVTVQDMNIKAFDYGVWLDFSSDNNVSGNNITAIGHEGIIIMSSSVNSICGNNVMANYFNGISLVSSSDNSISGNNITANKGYGIWIVSGSDNSITGNNITANNECGIYVEISSNNRVYHNNFVKNTHQVVSFGGSNVLDDGYPFGGNYWTDYTGVDANGDGIGDAPYTVDPNNVDRYPLMNPWILTSLSVLISPPSASIILGQSVTLTSNASGGMLPYSYQWYVYCTPVSGANLNSWTFTLHTIRNYSVWLRVTDSLGNTAASNQVSVAALIVGDLNNDGKVDMQDIGIAAKAFGSGPDDFRWNPNADINGDGKIDLKDIGLIARYFGQHYP